MLVFPGPASASGIGGLYKLFSVFFYIDKSNITFVGLYFFIQQIKNSLGTCLCHDDTVQLLTDLADGHVEALVKG